MRDAPGPEHSEPNATVDSDHPAIVAYARRHAGDLPPREAAVALYHAIRDAFRYDPWNVRTRPEDYAASAVLARAATEGAHCIDKANLLAACARAVGIPSRLHFADVRNHIGTARLQQELGTDLLVFHGYTELWLGGRWVAATPAFNVELCERLGVAPLAFDGVHDSIFQEFDPVAGRFMEYVRDRGTYAHVPLDEMLAAWREHYQPFRDGGWPSRPR